VRLPSALVLVVLAALLGGCGDSEPSPESVVRAWSTAVNTGDNEEAARLFAEDARVIQGDRARRLHDLDRPAGDVRPDGAGDLRARREA
jgi:hypothetical protein